MPGTVVSYERFLEIRQRRERVVAELARQPGPFVNRDSRDGELTTIDCKPVIDTHCGTRTQPAVVAREKNPFV
ncbi:MAG: hypothetical protein ACM3SQ_04775 [Betaproteobacteria bacterium]